MPVIRGSCDKVESPPDPPEVTVDGVNYPHDPATGKRLKVADARRQVWTMSWGRQVDVRGIYWVAERKSPPMRFRDGPFRSAQGAMSAGLDFFRQLSIPCTPEPNVELSGR
jgi:hypothetical protein